jgi:glutamyl/glutaminyl-tRNA synthetase
MTLSELIKNFDSKRMSKAPAFFDFKKMLWIGNAYIKAMNDVEYLKFVKPFITFDKSKFNETLDQVLLIFKSQISYGQQINDLVIKTFLSDDFNNISADMKVVIETPDF